MRNLMVALLLVTAGLSGNAAACEAWIVRMGKALDGLTTAATQ